MSLIRRFSWLIPAILLVLIPISAFAVNKEAKKHFDEAMKLKTNAISNAIEELKQAIKIDPKYVEAHYHLGTLYHHKKLFDEAMKEYKIVQKLNPKFPKLNYVFGAVYYTLGVFEWQKAAMINDTYLYKDDGKQVFYKKGTDPEKAISQYKKLVEKDTMDVLAHYNLRGVYYDLAIIEYEKVVKANPKDTSAQYDLGLVYLERGKLN
ncbi:MAG: tetratricopeptide repeat protein, partial [Candidatus Zixiibacteriota bacterium]